MKKKIFVKLSSIILIAVLLFSGVISGFLTRSQEVEVLASSLDNEYVKFWTAPITEKILRDSEYGDEKENVSIKLRVVRNEYENAQLIMTAKKNVSDYNVEVSDLASGNGDKKITKDNVKIYNQHYSYVARNLNGNGMPTGDIPDMLVPFANSRQFGFAKINEGENQGLFFTFYIPKDTEKGEYSGKITVSLEGKNYEIPVRIEVVDYTLSDERTARSMFSIGYIEDGELNSTPEIYRTYWDFMSEYRINPTSLKIAGMTAEDWAEECYKQVSSKTVNTIDLPSRAATQEGHSDVVTVESLTEYLSALLDVCIKYKTNLFDYVVFYNFWIDEPFYINYAFRKIELNCLNFDQAIQNVYDACSARTDLSASLKTELLNSIMLIPDLCTSYITDTRYDGVINAFCIKPDAFDTAEERKAYADNVENTGYETWLYTCNDPKYPYPSMHLDASGTVPRSLGWMMADYGIEGYLGWMTTKYVTVVNSAGDTKTETYFESAQRDGSGALGDGLYIYPGKVWGLQTPVPSIRLQMFRDGYEEYEMLQDIYKTYSNAGYDADSVLQMLYKNIYEDAKVTESSKGFAYSRDALLYLLDGLNKGLMITKFQQFNDNFEIEFLLNAGLTVKESGTTLSAFKTQNGYDFYKVTLSKQEKTNFVLTVGDEKIADVYLGERVRYYSVNSLINDLKQDFVADKQITTIGDKSVLEITTTAGTAGKAQTLYFESETINNLNKNIGKVSFNVYTDEKVDLIVCFKYQGSSVARAVQTLELNSGWNEIKLTNFATVNWTKEKMIENISFRIGKSGDGNQTIYLTEWAIVGGE